MNPTYWTEELAVVYTDKISGLRFSQTWCEWLGFEAWLSQDSRFMN